MKMNYMQRTKLFTQIMSQLSKELDIVAKSSTHYRSPELFDNQSKTYIGELEYCDKLGEYFIKNIK